jgi:hypothetical protein
MHKTRADGGSAAMSRGAWPQPATALPNTRFCLARTETATKQLAAPNGG